MHLLWTILIGFVAGLIARALMPGPNPMGFFITAALGVAGSLLATFLGQSLGWYDAGETSGLIASVIGAIVILAIYGALKRKRLR